MASVSVLYIQDDLVGPHLELLRNICEPKSKSRPHVTVRYFERLPIPPEHLSTNVAHIDLMQPGSFGLENGDQSPNRTVYIRCESEDLLPLEHKPHYPASEFHITLYDGDSVEFGRALLGEMRKFEWRIRVPLPDGTTLRNLPINQKKSKTAQSSRIYSTALQNLFRQITGESLSWDFLTQLPNEHRLELASAVAGHLHDVASHLPRVGLVSVSGKREDSSPLKNIRSEVHLTPPELARDIAQYAVDLLDRSEYPVHFGDPAVGNGAFYAALLSVLPRDAIASAIGIDIDPKQIAAAQWRWSSRGMQIMQGDYFHMEQLPARTIILANPPYLRHQKIPQRYKEGLRERASVVTNMHVSARSGLYLYFILLSHPWMAPNAISAWLIPSEFMQTDYGAALRYYLTHEVELIRIHRFDHESPQFENAMVLPSVVIFRNRVPRSKSLVHLTAGGTLPGPSVAEFRTNESLRLAHRWSVPDRTMVDQTLSPFRIGDLFDVRRGIATGANAFFILERAKAAALGIPEVALRPILPKSRLLNHDIIERADDGYPAVNPQLCLLDCDLSRADISVLYPRLDEYLATAEELGVLQRNLVANRKPWYKQERRSPPLFLCTYMGRTRDQAPPVRFLWNKSDAVATNTYLMLYPRGLLSRILEQDAGLTAELFEILRQSAATTMSSSLRIHADGLHKIEPGELLNVRLAATPHWLVPSLDLEGSFSEGQPTLFHASERDVFRRD